jgi:hypothetical protein
MSNEYADRICRGMDMILEKVEQIGREETAWSLDELNIMADITKDMSEVLKNLSKASMHNIKKY